MADNWVDTTKSSSNVRVLGVVPPAMVNPVTTDVSVNPLYVLPVKAETILLSAIESALQVPLAIVPNPVIEA